MTCSVCGDELQIGDFPFCPHGSILLRGAQGFAPVVVHRTPDGDISFPGSADDPVPSGYQKVELRTVGEIRALEREVNSREDAKHEEFQFRKREYLDGMRRAGREALLQRIGQFSDKGKSFAEAAMRWSDERKHERDKGPGFYVEAFSKDSSNREGHLDEKTGWKRRKE